MFHPGGSAQDSCEPEQVFIRKRLFRWAIAHPVVYAFNLVDEFFDLRFDRHHSQLLPFVKVVAVETKYSVSRDTLELFELDALQYVVYAHLTSVRIRLDGLLHVDKLSEER